MKGKSSLYFLLLGIILSGVAAVLVLSFLNSLQHQVPVVATTRPLQPFEEITQDNVHVIMVPRSVIQSSGGYFSKVDDVIGKHAVGYLGKNALLSRDQVTDKPGGPIVQQLNAEENTRLRAMEIPVKEKILAGKIRPGDYVDILGTTVVPQNINETIQNVKETKVIAEKVKVLQIGGQNSQGNSEGGNSQPTVVIAVDLETARQIAKAVDTGQLTMVVQPTYASASN